MRLLMKWLDWTLNLALILLMAGMVVVISAQVWYRFVINDPLDWSEEAGRYMFVWISFLGAAVGVRYKVHLGIDLMEKLTSPQVYRYIVVLVNLIIQIFLVVIIYQGLKIIEVVKFQSSASMNISMAWPYLAVPVGGLFMFINSIRLSWEAFTPKPIKKEGDA